jgi:DNA polymerase III gamma/tau subunit
MYNYGQIRRTHDRCVQCFAWTAGVKEVDEDVTSSVVRVRGKGIDPSKLCERVRKRSGKHCEVIPPPPEPEPKPEEGPKPEEEPKPEAEKKDEKPSEPEKKDEKPSEAEQKKDEKPSEAAEPKKDEKKPSEATAAAAAGEEEKKEEGANKPEAASAEPTSAEPDQTKKPDEFGDSDAVKKDADQNESAAVAVSATTATEADADLDSVLDMRKYEYIPYSHGAISGYVYPPQLFSDENPNACSLM